MPECTGAIESTQEKNERKDPMKMRFAPLAAAALCLAPLESAAEQAALTPPERLVADIDTRQTAAPVSKYVFGMFIEHIGRTMYSSLWAEMLDDRKFYFPIVAKDPEPKQPENPMSRMMRLRKWRPVGGDDVVVMDKEHPFVGDQSPCIALDAEAPHGIRQAGLALVKGKSYTGRVVVKGTPGARIEVALVWGSGASERQVVPLAAVTAAYESRPLSFLSPADASDAALEITGTGSGSFHVGAVSLMPADNIEGYRADTIALIKQIKSGFWRFGGNYTSGYNWYDAIGDRDRRPPTWDFAWNAMQTNDLGMDEFATLCRLIGVAPYISVNAGFGDAHSAAEQVEYMNGAATTHMGALRARNGHPEPYRVEFWNIGNEPWGSWQLGRTDLKYFVLKHNDFAKAMRKVDPEIVLVASGEMLEDGNVPAEMRAKYVGNLGPLYGTDADWTGGFLEHCWGNFDGMAEHWYASPGVHFDLEKARSLPVDEPSNRANVKVEQTLLEHARYPADIVRVKAEEWQGYQRRFPAILDGKIFLSVDEYAYFDFGSFGRSTTLKQALAYGMIFNEMLRHTDFMTMAAHTMGTSTLDISPTASVLNTLGLTFKLYGDHFVGSIPVGVSGNSPQPAPKYPVGGDQPKVSSGSPTYPLDVFAALTADRSSLTLAVVNATETAHPLDLSLSGMKLAGPATLWQITGANLDAANRVGQPPQVELKESRLGGAASSLTVAPISINVYRFAVTE
jgi:alpha-N-arabinofuranosidase